MGEFTGSEAGLDPAGMSGESRVEKAQQKISDIKQQANVRIDQLRHTAQDYRGQAKDQLMRVDSAVLEFARTNPMAAVAGALAAGFIIGRIASKI